MRVGFVGLGVMGRPMAGRVQAAGHELLLVKHRSPLPPELMAGGAVVCASKAELARKAEVVILVLPETAIVEAALFGEDGVAAGLGRGCTVIDMSSISPSRTRAFAKKIEEGGGEYLDAPVSGGEPGAISGTLSIMVGGKSELFERMLPVLSAMGQNVSLIGPVGAGQTAKVANQIIVALTIEAVAEGLLFASKAGIDPATVRSALMGGFASSRVLEVHGERMIARRFDPGARIFLHLKDLNLALEGARELGLSLPNTVTTESLFAACAERGEGDLDHSALIKSLEVLVDCEPR